MNLPKSHFELDGHRVTIFSALKPEFLFLQPVDSRDEALSDREAENLKSCTQPFALITFTVKNWNRELSLWEAPPVFGKDPFDGGAKETFHFIVDQLLPKVQIALSLSGDEKWCIGGYSLAGLFSLWAATRTGLFSAVAAASPSVWFPGWLEYVKKHPIQAKTVYLSLGDREEKTKNPVMATVGDCIWKLYAALQTDYTVVLEWNTGNHFQNAELRTARAYCWVASHLSC